MASFTAYTKCNTPNRLYTPILWKTVDVDLSKSEMASALAQGTHGIADLDDNEAVIGGFLFVSTAFAGATATVQLKVGSTALTGAIPVATLADETYIPLGFGLTQGQTALTDSTGATASSVLVDTASGTTEDIDVSDVNVNFASIAAQLALIKTDVAKLIAPVSGVATAFATAADTVDMVVATADLTAGRMTVCLQTINVDSFTTNG